MEKVIEALKEAREKNCIIKSDQIKELAYELALISKQLDLTIQNALTQRLVV